MQHARERDHPFNTARMVNLSLAKSKLICGSNQALANRKFPLTPRTGLLYPSKQAKTLEHLEPSERPDQLIIIDGTWPQARTLIRDLKQLHGLPHYKLAPTQPGQYRIRLEPNDTSLSTVEAAVEALRELEPDTTGLDQLISAFDQMVQQQLDHPRVGREHYSAGPRSGSTMNAPKQILGDANSIVVAYAEAAYRSAKDVATGHGERRAPVCFAAQRLGTNQTFTSTLKPDQQLTDTFLEHLELSSAVFEGSKTVDCFRVQWRKFLKPDDTVVVFNHGTIELLRNIECDFCHSVALKSINFDPQRPRRKLSQFFNDLNVVRKQEIEFGRTGRRLTNAVALVKFIREQCKIT